MQWSDLGPIKKILYCKHMPLLNLKKKLLSGKPRQGPHLTQQVGWETRLDNPCSCLQTAQTLHSLQSFGWSTAQLVAKVNWFVFRYFCNRILLQVAVGWENNYSFANITGINTRALTASISSLTKSKVLFLWYCQWCRLSANLFTNSVQHKNVLNTELCQILLQTSSKVATSCCCPITMGFFLKKMPWKYITNRSLFTSKTFLQW